MKDIDDLYATFLGGLQSVIEDFIVGVVLGVLFKIPFIEPWIPSLIIIFVTISGFIIALGFSLENPIYGIVRGIGVLVGVHILAQSVGLEPLIPTLLSAIASLILSFYLLFSEYL